MLYYYYFTFIDMTSDAAATNSLILTALPKENDLSVLYEQIKSSMWYTGEIEHLVIRDVEDWNDASKVNKSMKDLLTSVLTFFRFGDDAVNDNLVTNLMNCLPWGEAFSFYTFQLAQESIHSEVYKLLFERLVLDSIDNISKPLRQLESELQALVVGKAEWVEKYFSSEKSDPQRKLVCMCIMEGYFFSAAFAYIYWLKNRNLFPALTTSNNFIARDESLHFTFSLACYEKYYKEALTSSEKRKKWVDTINGETYGKLFDEAQRVEEEFWERAFAHCNEVDELHDFTLANTKLYGRYVLNCVKKALGVEGCGNVDNPYTFMMLIGLEPRTNFFEQKATDYQVNGMESIEEVPNPQVCKMGAPIKRVKPRCYTPNSDAMLWLSSNKSGFSLFLYNECSKILLKFPPTDNNHELYIYEHLYPISRLQRVIPPPFSTLLQESKWEDMCQDVSLKSIYDYRFSYLAGALLYYTKNDNHDVWSSYVSIESISRYHQDRKRSRFASDFELIPAYDDMLVKPVLTPLCTMDHDTLWNRGHWSYMAMRTLRKSYLYRETRLTDEKCTYERPEFLLWRVAQVCAGSPNYNAIIPYYRDMIEQKYIFGSSILFNVGKQRCVAANCFLLDMGDSIKDIYECLGEAACLSKNTGGVAIHISAISANKSPINYGQNESRGIMPLLSVINNQCQYVNQGGRREGSIAVYLEPWHKDILSFLQCRLGSGGGDASDRCRNIFTALWMPKLFFDRLIKDGGEGVWTLFDPSASYECSQLPQTFGSEFNELYEKLESDPTTHEGVQVPIGVIWSAIVRSLMETGTPYLLNKDLCNETTQHKHLGCITGSNLCAEIIQYTNPSDCTSVCHLANVNLFHYRNSLAQVLEYRKDTPLMEVGNMVRYKHEKRILYDFYLAVRSIVYGLNRIVESSSLPTKNTETGTKSLCALGIGVQGFALVLQSMFIAYEDEDASHVNAIIFEHLYLAAVNASVKYQRFFGGGEMPPWYENSPASSGALHPHLWSLEYFMYRNGQAMASVNHEYLGKLGMKVHKYGMRNSLLIALMPTASTSQIFDTSESVEPLHSNIFKKQTICGETVCVNALLQEQLRAAKMWDDDMAETIVRHNGSIQKIEGIPYAIKRVFKTVWEIPHSRIIELAAERQVWVDQSQSMNLYMANPTVEKVSEMLIASFNAGLKTIVYYLRTKAASAPIQWNDPNWFNKTPDAFRETDMWKTVNDPVEETCKTCAC
jgi:ribonucleoside-diphosphate reductase alpha subunit